ncbi:hypothetical protein [Flavobacterium croceum]|uniref:Uncharacterized protein n=1 Tax=Flavobacterium croceum DSM 17960 TaxID=1121886 RepID=A0A2S4NBV7_9FLAO|nr:hypothetical protein [Flavobacterium croceum]POS03189.1 hypothetical protein Q361_101298 [Flavobacterium croceum DSM 17960]
MKIWFLVCLLYSTVQAQSVYNKNEKIVNFVKTNGSKIAPTYKQAVCTELVIEVLQHFYALNSTDKNVLELLLQKIFTSYSTKIHLFPKESILL